MLTEPSKPPSPSFTKRPFQFSVGRPTANLMLLGAGPITPVISQYATPRVVDLSVAALSVVSCGTLSLGNSVASQAAVADCADAIGIENNAATVDVANAADSLVAVRPSG